MNDPLDDLMGVVPTLPKAEAFKLLDAVVPKRSSLPVLHCIKVEEVSGGLKVTATDLDYAVEAVIPNEHGIHGEACYDWKLFKVGILEASYPADEYPMLPEVDGDSVGTGWLRDGLKCLYAVSDDNTRLALNGVYVNQECVVATDGHRLHKVPGVHAADMIVPPKVFTLCKGREATGAHANDRSVSILFPWGRIVSKVIEGQYPNYKQVVPSLHGRQEVSVPFKVFQDACKQAVAVQKENPRVRLMGGHLWSSNGTGGLMQVCPVPMGAEFAVQLNAKYALESIAGITGNVVVSVAHPLKAVLFNPSESGETRILMPLRIED